MTRGCPDCGRTDCGEEEPCEASAEEPTDEELSLFEVVDEQMEDGR